MEKDEYSAEFGILTPIPAPLEENSESQNEISIPEECKALVKEAGKLIVNKLAKNFDGNANYSKTLTISDDELGKISKMRDCLTGREINQLNLF